MEDYFVQRTWFVCPTPPPPPNPIPLFFSWLWQKRTVNSLCHTWLLLKNFKKGEWQWASTGDEAWGGGTDWGDTDTIRPGLFGDPCDRAAFTATTMWDLVLQRMLHAPGVWVYQLRAICSSSSSSSLTLFGGTVCLNLAQLFKCLRPQTLSQVEGVGLFECVF